MLEASYLWSHRPFVLLSPCSLVPLVPLSPCLHACFHYSSFEFGHQASCHKSLFQSQAGSAFLFVVLISLSTCPLAPYCMNSLFDRSVDRIVFIYVYTVPCPLSLSLVPCPCLLSLVHWPLSLVPSLSRIPLRKYFFNSIFLFIV
jgi:hypothetical protein